jgi:carboxyl-terminal processing protease
MRRSSAALIAAAALVVLGVAACGSRSDSRPAQNADDGRELFTQGYEKITRYYLESTDAETLTMAGLEKLTSLDPDLAVKRDDKDVVLLRDGVPIGHFMAPQPADNWGWGGVTASVLTTARHASPKLAEAKPDEVDKTVFEGIVGTLDRFSHYASPTTARERRAERNGFGGIGVTLDAEETEVRILAVLPDSPAEHAGIKANDRIVSVDGTATSTLTREQVVRRLRGAPGTQVLVGIERPGLGQALALSVSRGHIVLPTVAMHHEGGVAVFRIASFNQETADQLVEAIAKAHKEMGGMPRGIVLDLRDNPGGLLDQSIKVSSLFLDGGLVVSTVGRVPESKQRFYAAPTHVTDGIPVAVLVNGGSASASEIVAAALQDTGRAVVIGTASFGKGTVQNVLELPNEGELTVTWARLITPEGYILHEHGVVPTVCTTNLNDDDSSLAHAVQVGTTRGTGPAANPRVTLDDQGWKDLRQTCPPERVDRDADLKVAERLVSDPTLYSRALNATPTTLARTAAAAKP